MSDTTLGELNDELRRMRAENERLREAIRDVILDSGVGYLQTELQDRLAAFGPFARVDDNSAR